MAYIKTIRRNAGNGGGGTPTYLSVPISEPYTAGDIFYVLPSTDILTGDGNSIILWFQKNFQQPFGADYTYNPLNGGFSFTFNFDPAVDYPETGIVTVDIWNLAV